MGSKVRNNKETKVSYNKKTIMRPRPVPTEGPVRRQRSITTRRPRPVTTRRPRPVTTRRPNRRPRSVTTRKPRSATIRRTIT